MAQSLGLITADFQTQLATAIAIGGTSVTIQSVTDDDGNTLPNGTYFFTIDGDNAQKEHIKCTLTGTSLSSIYSVSRNGTEASGVVRKHRVGATVTITNFAHIKKHNDLLDGTTDFDSGTPLGYDGDPGLSSGTNKFATVNYVDGVAIAGGADASTSVKGISKLSTAPASATNPIAVGDNDPRVPTTDENDALAGTSGTPSNSNKYVTADDVADDGTVSKILRLDANSQATIATTPTANTHAASKGYVDTQVSSATTVANTGQTSHLHATGTGTVNIAHGLGVTPKLVKITAIGETTSNLTWTESFGTATSTSDETCTYNYRGVGNGYGQKSSSIIFTADSGGSAAVEATLSGLDATNITLNFTTVASGKTLYIQWEAIA